MVLPKPIPLAAAAAARAAAAASWTPALASVGGAGGGIGGGGALGVRKDFVGLTDIDQHTFLWALCLLPQMDYTPQTCDFHRDGSER